MSVPSTIRNTAETMQEFFTKFGAGDRPGMLELFADEVDFTVPGSDTVPWTGHRSTHQQIAEFIRSALEDITTKKFDVTKIIVDGEDGIVLGEFAHEVHSTGKTFFSAFALHIRVTEGQIRLYHMFENSYEAANAFAK
jgi:ketosteroid isomerase-like protein